MENKSSYQSFEKLVSLVLFQTNNKSLHVFSSYGDEVNRSVVITRYFKRLHLCTAYEIKIW